MQLTRISLDANDLNKLFRGQIVEKDIGDQHIDIILKDIGMDTLMDIAQDAYADIKGGHTF